MAWAVRHVAALLCLYSMDDGGRSPMQRARGQARPREVAEFGEKVLFQPMVKYAATDKLARGGPPSRHGRSVRRIPETDRWDADAPLRVHYMKDRKGDQLHSEHQWRSSR